MDQDTATPVDTGIADEDLFNAALSDNQPAAQEPPESPQEPQGQPRDEHGRFVSPQAQEPPAPPAQQPQAPAQEQPLDHRIPLAEYLSTRERAQRAEQEREAVRQQLETMQRQLADMQRQRQAPPTEPQEEPDPLLDPKGFREHMARQQQAELAHMRREMSLQMASRFYKDEFPEAYKAAQAAMYSGDDALRARMNASADPGETLIQWYREQRTMKEVGSDPNAWLEKKIEERMKDPAFLAKAIEAARGQASATTNGTGKAPAVQLPPSLSRATGAAQHAPPLTDADMSDEALFAHALRS